MKTLAHLMELKGRGALITGGAGHIGLAAAEALMELGSHAAIVDLDAGLCQKRCDLLNAKGYTGRAFAVAADMSKEEAIQDAVRQSAKDMGSLDIVVHCAAFVGTTQFPGWVVPFDQQNTTAWDACMKVNVTAAFILARESFPHFQKNGHGSMVLVSSIHGMVGPDMNLYEGTKMGNPMAYGVSKAGLIQMARYLASLWGSKARANVISPGGVWRNQDEKFHERYKKRTPMGRMAVEEDLKGAVAFLASDLSAYVNGHNLVVDGGYTAW